MKKITALLLALVMVLSLGTVAFAKNADGVEVGDAVTDAKWDATIDTAAELWEDGDVFVHLNWTKGVAAKTIKANADGMNVADTTEDLLLKEAEVTVTDDANQAAILGLVYDVAANASPASPSLDTDWVITVATDVTGYVAPKEIYVKIDMTFAGDAGAAAGVYVRYSKVITVKAAADDKAYIDTEVFNAIKNAVDAKSTVVQIDLSKLANPGFVTAMDFAFITNTWYGSWTLYDATTKEALDGGWYPNYNYLAMDFNFYWPAGTRADGVLGGTSFYFKAADLDYQWAKAIDFNETDGLGNYLKSDTSAGKTYYTKAEMIKTIRALTADVTKDPYVFGFAHATTKDYGYDIPNCTISKVIPQQWINVYGHKNLQLSVFGDSDKCTECGATVAHAHIVADDVRLGDAATQTQRIQFETETLYKTMILSKALAVEEAPAKEKTDDANPNTGANDVVNVAIVFAVVSLVAAGAYVATKK